MRESSKFARVLAIEDLGQNRFLIAIRLQRRRQPSLHLEPLHLSRDFRRTVTCVKSRNRSDSGFAGRQG